MSQQGSASLLVFPPEHAPRSTRALGTNSSGPGILARIDRDGRCLWVSPRSAEVMGWTTGWLRGRELASLVHPDDAPRDSGAPWLRLLASHCEPTRRYQAADGTYKRFTVTAASSRGANGKLADLLVTFTPVESAVGLRVVRDGDHVPSRSIGQPNPNRASTHNPGSQRQGARVLHPSLNSRGVLMPGLASLPNSPSGIR